jgi:predicted O-linked N-acetylglucosamine transferase (SPINDLY family)
LLRAESHLRRARRLKPDDSATLNNLGRVVFDLGKADEAINCCKTVLALRPDDADALNNLGNFGSRRGVDLYRRALILRSDFAAAQCNMGSILQDLGRLDEAIACYRRALAIKPNFITARSSLLTALHYSPHYDGRALLEEAWRYGERVERGVVGRDFGHSRDVGRRLRIGYVSADLRAHPVGYFLSRVLSAHDHDAVEVTCYSNSATQDAVTSRLRQSAHRWRDIMLLPDRAAAAMIAADGIDILVDLAGHTAKNRLPLFALKPAPIQVSWLGFFGTTGLGAMDYVLGDQVVAPAGDEAYFTEALWRLPGCYLCYDPPRLAVPNGPFPALRNGFVTFGCFNNRTKISDGTVAAWAALLHRVEASRLFLKSRSFTDAECQSALVAQFAAHGIPPERLILEGHEALAQALAAYNRVDIALDPFPFGGGTTTAETLWMGVPLVTLRGERWVGRISASILTALDLTDWVTDDIEGYIDLAARLAADLPGLTDLRASLRHRLETSGFCDGPAFTRSLEAAYRAMWRIWCEGR